MTDPIPRPETALEVTTWFVRERNALLARAEFSSLYVDYYLHLSDHGMRYAPAHDTLFKDLVAALALHAAGRPWNETIAWTLNLQDPLLNMFATANNSFGLIVGQVFAEGVKQGAHNLFCSDVVPGPKPPRRSIVPFDGSDIFHAVEAFYAQSEQRTARLFRAGEEEFLMISAQPGCDEEWLRSLEPEAACDLAAREQLGFLEKRAFRWECGCTQQRMCEVLGNAMRGSDPGEFFGGDEMIRMSCPRCGARHKITRETMEAFLSGR